MNNNATLDINVVLMIVFAAFIALYVIAVAFGSFSQSMSGVEGIHNETDPTAFDKADDAAATVTGLVATLILPIGIGVCLFILFGYFIR